MGAWPFILICPATRGLSLALTRHYLRVTNLPVFATYRSGVPADLAAKILAPLDGVEASRLTLLPLDLTSEDSISAAAQQLSDRLPKDRTSYLHTALLTSGVLYPERRPSDLDNAAIQHTFHINVVAHLLLIKHFSRFLPTAKSLSEETALVKWVHVSARVGSIADNQVGGWYSYRASKAALNQVIKTFNLQLERRKTPAICIGVHPGTVKTDLSKDFWRGVANEKLFEPEDAAQKLANIIASLGDGAGGKIWDWKGNEVPP
jgi:NAD(P)-dependent dehydrogenase (short-subunit alcohol dehydrogenase family)